MKKLIIIMPALVLVLIAQGCYKVATVEINNGPAVTKTVSLSKDIIPIFEKSCALAGCHTSGGHVPDLSASSAYNSLLKGNYITLAKPANSEIYLWLTGGEPIRMPMGADNNPSNINALILAWITQGAKNN